MNKHYTTFVYLDGNKIKLRTVFNVDNDVNIGFDNEFTHQDEKSIEFQDKINSLITYFGETIKHKMVRIPLHLATELGLNKLFQAHLKNMIQQLIEMVDTNEITNSQLGEILGIVKLVSVELECEYYKRW